MSTLKSFTDAIEAFERSVKGPKLTKFLYGTHTDSSKSPFGLLNNQYRVDGIITNAGWFNGAGDRIGAGDLSLEDMQRIAKSISTSEMFIVLSEFDSSWGVPSSFDQSAPGKDYVMKKAVWVIGRDPKVGSIIMRVRDDISKLEEASKDGVKYHRFPRSDMYVATGYMPSPPKAGTKPIKKVSTQDSGKKVMVPNPLVKTAPSNPVPIPSATAPFPSPKMPPVNVPPFLPISIPKKTGNTGKPLKKRSPFP